MKKIELGKLVEESIKIFEINNISELADKLKEITISNKYDYYVKFKNLVEDLKIDWLQKIFQYYEADRVDKKQDYTPTCLAEFIAKLSNGQDEDTVIDMCAGSGALTIQMWKENPKLKFVCKEFDEKVIPYLLFNLAVKNIDAIVEHMDVLENKVFNKYKVIPQGEFGRIEVIK